MTNQIRVTSHVGRDLLQNAAYFSTVPKVVWEYVSNAIDNPGETDSVTVEVSITKERIAIKDDGAGMIRDDLTRFFQMHAENIQRKRGKKVRGRFGTGKCAAFGIASRLRVETARARRLNIVELDRQDIQTSSGDSIRVREIVTDAETSGATGTTIIISNLETKQLEIQGTIQYMERHLGRQNQRHTVIVNHHFCQIHEPVSVRSRRFTTPPDVAARIGDLEVTMKVSPTPLDAGTAGIDVYSYGNWHDTTLAGLPETDTTRRIFGEVEVPALEDYEGPFAPFDNTRNNTLRPQNPLVATLFGWLSTCIREVVQELDAEEAERRRSREAKALRSEADKIQTILNDDFQSLQLELERARKTLIDPEPTVQVVAIGKPNPDSDYFLPDPAGDNSTEFTAAGPEPGDGKRGSELAGLGEHDRPGSGIVPGDSAGTHRDPIKRLRRSSAFTVEYSRETDSAPRSRYDETSKTIFINLDHPQLGAAHKLGGHDSNAFRQIAYELAFVEYAMALSRERILRDTSFTGEEALYEIRDTIDRITRRMKDLF